jgi:hypothetical protein
MFQGPMMRYFIASTFEATSTFILTASRFCFLTFYINTAFLHVSKYEYSKKKDHSWFGDRKEHTHTTHTHTNTNTHTHKHKQTRTRTHKQTNTQTRTHKHKRTHTNTHTHTHKHTHTHRGNTVIKMHCFLLQKIRMSQKYGWNIKNMTHK